MRKTAKLSLGVGAVVAIGAIAFGAQQYYGSEKYSDNVVAVVGKHEIVNDDIRTYLGEKLAKDKVLDCVMGEKMFADMAPKYKVSVTDAEVTQELMARTGTASPYHAKFLKVCIRRDMLKGRIQDSFAANYTGQLVVANFDQRQDDVDRPDINDNATDAQRKADRDYAKTFIDTLYANVNSDTMTMAQAIAAELAEPRIGQVALGTSIHSGDFDTTDKESVVTRTVLEPEVSSKMKRLKPGQLTPVLVMNGSAGSNASTQKVGVRYAFIKLETATPAQSGSFDEAVASQKKLGYKVLK